MFLFPVYPAPHSVAMEAASWAADMEAEFRSHVPVNPIAPPPPFIQVPDGRGGWAKVPSN